MSHKQTHDTQDQSERKRPNISNFNSARDHQSLIEKQIREAMERGDFDNLRGAGKPQNLARDPNVPEDWELAFNLLKNAGFAPDWIETRKEVDTAREKLFAPLQRLLQTPPLDQIAFTQQQTKLVQNFRAQAIELNRQIDTYNLKAPTPQVHLRRIRVQYEIEKFLSACAK